MEERFPDLEKEMPAKVQELYTTLNRMSQKRNSPRHIIIKTQNKERILKATREKEQMIYKYTI